VTRKVVAVEDETPRYAVSDWVISAAAVGSRSLNDIPLPGGYGAVVERLLCLLLSGRRRGGEGASGRLVFCAIGQGTCLWEGLLSCV
jgi:hypothetical protein